MIICFEELYCHQCSHYIVKYFNFFDEFIMMMKLLAKIY
jgi:hypothetical protein